MVYERRLASRSALYRELKSLEVDSGIRAKASGGSGKGLIFITRHSGEYHLWIREDGATAKTRGTFKTFRSLLSLRLYLEEALANPLHAYAY